MQANELHKAVLLAVWFSGRQWQDGSIWEHTGLGRYEFHEVSRQAEANGWIESRVVKAYIPGRRFYQGTTRKEYRLTQLGIDVVQEMLVIINGGYPRGKLS